MIRTAACLVLLLVGMDAEMPRRTDITDKGDPKLFHGWADVQGQGVKNDYCRFIVPDSENPNTWLSCALAGTEGDSQYNYNPPNGGTYHFDVGHKGTWFMADKNGDGRDDYCRYAGHPPNMNVSCMLAYTFGFGCDQYEHAVPEIKGFW